MTGMLQRRTAALSQQNSPFIVHRPLRAQAIDK